MSSPEFKIGQIVKIIDDSEYPYANVKGEIGIVIGTIPPKSKKPHRVMVRFGEDGFLNLRHKDLRKVVPQ